jgi:hypothetical protein
MKKDYLDEVAGHVLNMHAATGAASTPDSAAEALQRACGELCRTLETAMGLAGLQALVGRAVQIATRQFPWLASIRPAGGTDLPLEGLAEAVHAAGAEDARAGCVALLAAITRLLITFIGEDLTLRFVRQAWPEGSFIKLSEGRENE